MTLSASASAWFYSRDIGNQLAAAKRLVAVKSYEAHRRLGLSRDLSLSFAARTQGVKPSSLGRWVSKVRGTGPGDDDWRLYLLADRRGAK